MARTGRGRNRRMFVWARSAMAVPVGESTAGIGFVDLLNSVRARYGGKEFVGATVMSVRGYVKPTGDGPYGGRIGLRICNEGDIPDPAGTGTGNVDDGPGDGAEPGGNPEADWMAFLPFLQTPDGAATPATWNHAANPWAVDIRSNRRMEELGQTLGLFADVDSQTAPEGAQVVYDLSVGLKLS